MAGKGGITRVFATLLAVSIALPALVFLASKILIAEQRLAPQQDETQPIATVMDRDLEAETTRVSLVMVGDILLHTHVVNCYATEGGYDFVPLFAHVADEIASKDIAIVNQETPLGGEDKGYFGDVEVPYGEPTKDEEGNEVPAPTYPVFNSPDQVADAEAAVGFDIVLKAHNHVFDQGYSGLAHELAYWHEHYPEISVLGVADPYGESGAPDYAQGVYVYEKNGFRIAFLNYCYGTNSSGGAYDGSVLSYISEDKILSDVAKAREAGAHMIVANVHWGTEYENFPNSSQTYFAQFMADAGINVIFGTHPHVIQPVHVLTGSGGNQCVCFYSNGNFTTANPGNAMMVTGLSEVTLARTLDGDCWIESASFLPAVVHGGSGHEMTTYLLRDWTDELASTSYNPVLTKGFVEQYCKDVLGDGFSTEDEAWHAAL